jgi:hypothetical protein
MRDLGAVLDHEAIRRAIRPSNSPLSQGPAHLDGAQSYPPTLSPLIVRVMPSPHARLSPITDLFVGH